MCEFTLVRMKQYLTIMGFVQILPGALAIHTGKIFDIVESRLLAAVFVIVGIFLVVGSLLLILGSCCQKFNYLLAYFIFCGWLLMIIFGLLIYFIIIWSIYVDSFIPRRASIQLMEYFKGDKLNTIEEETVEGTGVFIFFSLGASIIFLSVSVLISMLILYHPKLKNKNMVYHERAFDNVICKSDSPATPSQASQFNQYEFVGNNKSEPSQATKLM